MFHERLLLRRHKVGLAELATHNCLHLIRVQGRLSVHRHHPWESHLKHRWIHEGLLLAGHREAAIRHGSINYRVLELLRNPMPILSWSAPVVKESIRIQHLNLLLHLQKGLPLYKHGDLLVSSLTELLKSNCFAMIG